MHKNKVALSVVCLGMLLFPPNGLAEDGAGIEYFAVGDHQAFILKPAAAGPATPWVWYAPAIVGSQPNHATDWLFQQLLDNGIAVAGIDVGESYGSPAGRATYSEFYTYATGPANLSSKACLLGQSRGALMAYNWAAENADKVGGIAGIYPACDLGSYPGLATAAPAYDMTEQELAEHLSEHNPIDRLTPLAQAGVSIFHIAGDSDTIVPLVENSQVVYDRYTALGGQMELVVIPGRGHEEIDEYFQSPELLDFLTTHVSAVPEPGTGALLGAALSCLAAYVWRRRR